MFLSSINKATTIIFNLIVLSNISYNIFFQEYSFKFTIWSIAGVAPKSICIDSKCDMPSMTDSKIPHDKKACVNKLLVYIPCIRYYCVNTCVIIPMNRCLCVFLYLPTKSTFSKQQFEAPVCSCGHTYGLGQWARFCLLIISKIILFSVIL
jgi:hypothetical protein